MSLSGHPDVQPLLLGLFLSMYLVTVLGNLLIILAVTSDSHLYTPMYFFLCNLSLTDVGFTSTMVPKIIADILIYSPDISYAGCLIQVSVVVLFGAMGDLLLTVMAYDQFVAICNPLNYQVIMSPNRFILLVSVSFGASLLDALLQDLLVSGVTYFKGVEMFDFSCVSSQILNLTCADTISSNILIHLVCIIDGFVPVSGILFSYSKIVSSILRVPSPGGRYKTFFTCGSHLTVVCLFYETALGMYLSSSFSSSAGKGALASLVYTVVTPMLDPFIYSLRNKDMKRAMRKLLKNAVIVSVPSIWITGGLKSTNQSYRLMSPTSLM